MHSKEETELLLDARMRRGRDADELMRNVLLKQALISLEADLIRKLKGVREDDIESRDAWWRELRAMERFKTKLESYARIGHEAAESLSLMQKIKQKATLKPKGRL